MQTQGHIQGLLLKDQDKDKDFNHKDQDKDLWYKHQDKDNNFARKDKDKVKDYTLVLKESLRTRTRINITGSASPIQNGNLGHCFKNISKFNVEIFVNFCAFLASCPCSAIGKYSSASGGKRGLEPLKSPWLRRS